MTKIIDKALVFVTEESAVATVINMTVYEGSPELILIAGDNVSGKSFVSRMFSLYFKKRENVEAIRVGMDTRCEGGMARVFITAGLETSQSTGANSSHTVKGAFNTSKNREHDHVIILDEPEIGLSKSYQRAMTAYMAQCFAAKSDKLLGLILTTHSAEVVKGLSGFNPTFVWLGDEPVTMDDFVAGRLPERSVEDFLKLVSASSELRGRINKALSEAK